MFSVQVILRKARGLYLEAAKSGDPLVPDAYPGRKIPMGALLLMERVYLLMMLSDSS